MLEVQIVDKDPTIDSTLKSHKNQITGLAFHSNNIQLASSSYDKFVMIWNFKSVAKRTFKYTGHNGPVYCVDFLPEVGIFATGSQDQTVRLIVPSILGKGREFKAHTGAVRSVCFLPCKKKVLQAIFMPKTTYVICLLLRIHFLYNTLLI